MWLVADILPKYLLDLGFTLREDEDFAMLSHDGEMLARYTASVPYWTILSDAKLHLRHHHGITDHLELVNGTLRRVVEVSAR